MQLFGGKKLVGLDIGANCIKLVELSKSRKGVTLERIGIIKTPEKSYINGDIINLEDVSAAVSEIFSEHKINKKNVGTVLNGAQVVVKKISIPKIDERLLAEQLKWEAEQYIPYELHEVNLDYNVLNHSDDPSSMSVLVVAALREAISKNLEIATIGGFSLEVIDVTAFSLFNVFDANYDYADSDRIVLFNIGAQLTNFVVIENKEIIFCRDIPVGGQSYTQEIENALGIGYEEAEALKISASNGEEVPEEVISTITHAHDFFCEEINSTIEFFLNSTDSSGFTSSYVTGGGLKVFGLYEKMVKNYKVKRLDPFLKVELNAKNVTAESVHKLSDFSSIAMGLAVGMGRKK